MLGDISLTEEELGMLFGPASNGVDGCSTLHAAANNRKSTRNAPGKRAAAKMKAKTSSTNKFCATLLSTVGGGIVPARCGYRTGKCQNLQAIKRNGKLHKLCEFHRERANLNQKKLDRKKRMQRSKLSRVPSSSCESVSSASSVISEDDNCSLDLENRSPRTVEAAVTTSVFIKTELKELDTELFLPTSLHEAPLVLGCEELAIFCSLMTFDVNHQAACSPAHFVPLPHEHSVRRSRACKAISAKLSQTDHNGAAALVGEPGALRAADHRGMGTRRQHGPMSRRYETLLTPAPYAFSIWGFIYTFLAATVVVDCFWPSVSTSAPNASVLRTLFAVSCLMNMAWIVFFTNEYVNVATVTLVILWLSLFALYAHIVTERATLASTLSATAIRRWRLLSLTSYVALLSLLAVATLSAVIYEGDVAFGLVVVWALVGLAAKTTTLDARVELIAMNIRACARRAPPSCRLHRHLRCAQAADPQTQFQPLQSGAPLYGDKPVDYGTTHAEASVSKKNRRDPEKGREKMATLRAALQETARLPWVNAAFFGLQSLLTCIGLAVGNAADVRAQTDTLLTPAAYAFSIWNVIYLLCMILLITDVSYAGLSLYDSAAKPNALRLCFAASCVANGTWCIVLASGNVLGASVVVSLLWLTLLPLYVFASYERSVKTVLWHEYLCSELCIRLYFAWITVEAVVGWTMTLQIKDGGYLQLSTYLTILSVLLVVALSGFHTDFEKIQAAATLGAGVLVAMVLVSCSYWIIELTASRSRCRPARDGCPDSPKPPLKTTITARSDSWWQPDVLPPEPRTPPSRSPRNICPPPTSCSSSSNLQSPSVSSIRARRLLVSLQSPRLECHRILGALDSSGSLALVPAASPTASTLTPNNPLAPPAYVFYIWVPIYVFTGITVITDRFYPTYSFYLTSDDPSFLRQWFQLACLANMSWVALDMWFSWVHMATFALTVLWCTMLPLYLFVVRHPTPRYSQAWIYYFCSEFSVRLYFGWLSADVIFSIADVMQYLHGGYFGFSVYAMLLGALLVLAFGTVRYVYVVIGKPPGFPAAATSTTSHLCSRLRLSTERQFQPLQSGAPLYGDKPVDYGTTHA
ncbi:hypothetical protein GQ600_5702 [Phytophthora cactorum]|nr:hypothetical protein GQ600_5702 [Phytophthora cactorum]